MKDIKDVEIILCDGSSCQYIKRLSNDGVLLVDQLGNEIAMCDWFAVGILGHVLLLTEYAPIDENFRSLYKGHLENCISKFREMEAVYERKKVIIELCRRTN